MSSMGGAEWPTKDDKMVRAQGGWWEARKTMDVPAWREGERRSGGVVDKGLGSQPPPPDTARLSPAALSCR